MTKKAENKTENKIKLISGSVVFAGKNNDGKNSISITITPEQVNKITEALGLKDIADGIDSNPIKISDEGELSFKASSKYGVLVFVDGQEQDEDSDDYIRFTDIGQESQVQIGIIMKEVPYRKKLHQVAYLQSVNVIDLVPFEQYNPYDAEDVTAL